MPGPVRGNFQITNIIAGDKLRSGDFINARVKSVLPNGRFLLNWNGRVLTAKSRLKFRTGQVIRARVERRSGGFFLHLVDSKKTAPPILNSQTATRTLLSAALLRAGLSLPNEAEAARRVALLNRTKGHRVRLARLYSELLAKGADPSADFLEFVDNSFSGGNDRRSGHWSAPPESGDLREELTEDEDGSDPLMNLLNSSSDKPVNWLFSRIIKNLGDVDIRILWKIRRGMDPALALTITDGSRTFEFLLEGLEKTRMSVYVDKDTVIEENEWYSFRRSLALMNVEVDDTILSIEESDGFTTGTAKAVRDLEGL